MASLTIKNIPPDLLEALRIRSAAEHRSLTRQVIYLLERALRTDGGESVSSLEVDLQVGAWRNLPTRWVSDDPPADEVERIYRARSSGRDVDL